MTSRYGDWAERPCTEEWTVNRRPCPWFKAGKRCEETWGDLVTPLQYVVIFVAELNIVLAGSLIMDAVMRKRAYSGATFGAPYQRLVYVVFVGFTALGIASLDLNGGNRILSVGWRLGLQVSLRVAMELALFEVGDSYTHALRVVLPIPSVPDRIPARETHRVLVRAALAALFSGSIATWEVWSVPRRQRDGCLLSIANTVRNVGTALIDFSFFLYILSYAKAAKRIISVRLENQPSSKSLAKNKQAVDVLTTHCFALCCCMGAVLSFALVAAVRNANAGKFLCEQPACTLREYPSRILWGFWYHIGLWVIVVAMVPNRLASRISNAVTKCALRDKRRAWLCCCCRSVRLATAQPRLTMSDEEDQPSRFHDDASMSPAARFDEQKVEMPDRHFHHPDIITVYIDDGDEGHSGPPQSLDHHNSDDSALVDSNQLRSNCTVS